MKALGQSGLDFIAGKYKELKALVNKKADKSEIITEEERHQLEVNKRQLVAMEIADFESKLESGSVGILKYPNGSRINLFNFIEDIKSGKIKPPEGTVMRYTYSIQQWFLNSDKFKSYALCDLNMQPLSLEKIATVKKEDGTMCLVPQIAMDGIETYFTANKTLITTNEYFVKKENGKGLSTNDYDNTAKSKVDAIPANPKYTDTTYDLSKYAEKSNISRCKTKGYGSASSWSSASSSRDLEDWIGDFDKRTRELKNNKGLTGDKSEISQQVIPCSSSRNCDLVAKKWGRYVELSFYFNYDSDRSAATSWEFMIPEKFMPGGNVYGKLSNGEYELVSPSNSSEARLTVIKDYGLRGGLIAGNIIYLGRNQ